MKFNNEPKTLQFPDEPQEKKRMNKMTPGALNFGEDPIAPTPSAAPQPVIKKATGPVPKPIMFNDPPESAQPVQHPTNQTLNQSQLQRVETRTSTPSIVTPQPSSIGRALFENQIPPLVRKAIDAMKVQYPDLYKVEGPSLESKLGELLPFKLDVLNSWGSATMEKQADLTTKVAGLVHNYSELNAAENLEEIVAQARGTNQNSFSKFFKSTPDFKGKRFAILSLQQQINNIIPQIDDCFQEEQKLQQKVLLAVASLSVAAQIAGTPSDNTLAICLQNRRILLNQGAKQAEILVPQLKELRKQVSEVSNKMNEILNVTLPALELAHAAKLK